MCLLSSGLFRPALLSGGQGAELCAGILHLAQRQGNGFLGAAQSVIHIFVAGLAQLSDAGLGLDDHIGALPLGFR